MKTKEICLCIKIKKALIKNLFYQKIPMMINQYSVQPVKKNIKLTAAMWGTQDDYLISLKHKKHNNNGFHKIMMNNNE